MAKKARKRVKSLPDPFKWHDQPLIAGHTFLTLPKGLLTSVTDQVGRNKFDPDLLKLDEELSNYASAHPGVVGFLDGRPIFYPYLDVRSSDNEIVSANEADRMGWTHKQADAVNGMGGFLASQHNQKISYCGWLMCRPAFRTEHDDLVKAHTQVAGSGPPEFTQLVMEGESELDGEQSNLMDQWCSFYSKWRINKLLAPGLPDPAGVQWTDLGRDFTPAHLQDSTSGPRIPDTQMLPEGDTLRALMKDQSPAEQDWHLHDWKSLIDPSNPSKNKIERYVRLFRLQHYWKVLFSRHGASLRRQTGRLEHAFADYLGIDHASIRKDLQHLRDQLGPDWFQP